MYEIRKKDELEELFHTWAKPRDQWRIGTEYEKIGIDRSSGKAIPYSGRRGVEAILKSLVERYQWEPKEEDGHVIALKGEKAEIHLEPGGQIELSGEPCESIHCSFAEFNQHIRELLDVSEELDVAFLGLGMQPVSAPEEIEWVPKRRYRIMGPYMSKVGSMGHRMMKQTATVQANIDYGDEADAMAKFRTGMGIAPLINAIFANSPISEGVLNGYKSFRGHIWTLTDRHRCGLLPFAFFPDVTFGHFVEYALDVPMYFIMRDGNFIDFTGIPFRRYLAHGHQGYQALQEDWELHLTTLFPEVRIKRYMEIRSADSQSPELMPSLSALIKGIFYDSDCLGAAWDLVKPWSWDERMKLYHDTHVDALEARIRRYSVLDLSKELFSIAWEGLKRQRSLNSKGEDETIYLKPLQDLLVNLGKCPADLLEEQWDDEEKQGFTKLIDYSAYRLP